MTSEPQMIWGDPETVQVMRFVHRVQHLRWRKGLGLLPEGEWVAECWMPDGAPLWALESAKSGVPGSRWCPGIDPTLRDRAQP